MIDEKLVEEVRKFTESSVSKQRYEHSLRTAETCSKLCKRFGLEDSKGYFAGLSHDMCKEFSSEELISLALKDGKPLSDLEKQKPSLLHGRAAAILLHKKFLVDDSQILEAVAVHTFGKPGMCELSKVLYVADKIEPGREHITEKYLAKLETLSLDELTCKVLQDNINHLLKKGRKVAPESIACFETIKENEKAFAS